MNCKRCGQEFRPSKYAKKKQMFCSRKCESQWRYEHPKYDECICKHCGKTFIPKAPERTTYCSRECAFADKAKRCKNCGTVITGRQGDYCSEECKMKTHKCLWCGKKYKSAGIAGYCSDECRKARERKRYHDQFISTKETNPAIKKKCRHCGIGFQGNYYASVREFCSKECARKHFRQEYKVTRKRQMQQAFVEPVSFRKIYKRDKGLCQICGEPVAFDKTPEDPMGATIDHIIPLSKGGKHHPDNCQLAHRICNSLKGDYMPEAIGRQRGRA